MNSHIYSCRGFKSPYSHYFSKHANTLNESVYFLIRKSLHSDVNSDRIISLLKSNSEKIYNLEDTECYWIYQYNRKTIEDFTNFLQELLQTDSNVFYINIC